jgi:hypothetical protein
MAHTPHAVAQSRTRSFHLLAGLVAFSVVVSLATAWVFSRSSVGKSLFLLSNLVGPTTQSLLHGNGLTVCTEAMGTPQYPICFHAGRMPLPSLVVGLGIRLLGDHYQRVMLFKTCLMLLPVELAIYLAWLRMPHSRARRLMTSTLLLAPFVMTAFLANVVNMQVEEGYSYGLMALAVAILFFGTTRNTVRSKPGGLGEALLFALALDGIYLAKSSMAPAVAVLVVSYFLLRRRMPWVVFALVVVAPLGWAVHQHHASGRYSLGTSLDGINLHKGNNPEFLEHYPPLTGATLDQFDEELNHGLRFNDEWSFNDYHEHTALEYARGNLRSTLVGDLRKLDVLFLSVHRVGTGEEHGALRLAATAGLVLFRLILWASILCAAYVVFRPEEGELRVVGGIYLSLVVACVLPYIAGFAYTRHVSVLIYPAVLMCCRMLGQDLSGYVSGTQGETARLSD